MAEFTKTLKVRVRDKHANRLRRQAAEVNRVWNFVNELSHRSIREHRRFLSAYDLQKYTNGSGKLLGLHSQTVQRVSVEYVTRLGAGEYRRSGVAQRAGSVSRSTLSGLGQLWLVAVRIPFWLLH